jgi:hypothetical protein
MKVLRVLHGLNRNAVVGMESGLACIVEDVVDPDGRWYRMEYRSTPDAEHAVAFCIHNPWGGKNGGAEYAAGHVASDGFLCLGTGVTRTVANSPFDLKTAILKSRYWCTAFSAFKETGRFPNP